MLEKSVLVRSDAERARVVDMSRRLRPVSRRAIALLLAAGVIATPTFGWWPVVALIVAGGVCEILQARLDRFRRPEYALAASWLLSQAMVFTAIAVADGPSELLFPLFAFPVMLIGVTWPTRTVIVGALLSALALVVVAFATSASLVLALPPVLVCSLALLLCTALIATTARDAEVESRGTAVVDQLTGTLNRHALEARVTELEHEAATTARPVALIVGDIDHFKRTNDEHGHATGDVVLREIAYRLRKALPPFAGVYRYGGEEFVVVLADADAAEAADTAERLRAAILAEPVAGVPVTMSFGVAGTDPGRLFAFDTVFARADRALYDAKAGGRDRVHVAEAPAGVVALRRPRPERRRPPEAHVDPVAPAVAAAARSAVAGRDEPTGRWSMDALQRQHLLELTAKLRRRSHVPYLIALLAVLVAAPAIGWWTLVPVVLGSVVFRGAERRLDRFARPELALGVAWLVGQACNAAAYVVSDLPGTSITWTLPLLIIMVIGSSAVFPGRFVAVGAAYTGALMIALAAWFDPAYLVSDPAELAFPLALLGAIALVGAAVGDSAVHHRGAAVVDRLTGLLNRRALEARSVELAHQAAATGAPVAVIIGDLDHFKRINDTHGHLQGDAALEAIGPRLRRHLRAFEDLYRFGGEEFAILLAGASAEDAARTAERLRRAIAGSPLATLDVTMSFGVAASAGGEPFDFETISARADRALYEAKRSGRDRVCAWSPALDLRAAAAAA